MQSKLSLINILAAFLFQFQLGPMQLGLLFLITSVSSAISSPFWGWLVGKYNHGTLMMIIGLSVTAVGLLLLGPSPILPHIPKYWIDFKIFRIKSSIFQEINRFHFFVIQRVMAQYCLPCSDWDICCIGLCTYISGFTSTRSVFIFNNFKNQFRLTDKR